MRKSLLWLLVIIVGISMIFTFSLIGCKEEAAPAEEAVEEAAPAEEEAEEAVEEAAPAEKVTIKFWKSPHGNDGELLAPIFDAFEKENPNVEIEYLETPWEGFDEKYGAAFAAGDPPDISYMPDEYYPRYANAGQLAKLDELGFLDLKDQFLPGAWEVGNYGGNQYGIPFIGVALIFYYNKDMFEEAGLDPERGPDTWEELIEYSKKLTKKDANGEVEQYGFGIQTWAFSKTINWFYFIQAGADMINDEKTEVLFNSPEGLKTVEFITDFFLEHKTVPDVGIYPGYQEVEAFGAGKIAMIPTGSEATQVFKSINPDLNYGMSYMPKGPAEEPTGRACYTGTGFWVIAEACENKDVAYELIKFISKPENTKSYLIDGLHMLSTRPDMAQYYEAPEVKLSADSMAKYGVAFPSTTHCVEMLKLLNEEIETAEMGQKTPQEALNDAEAAINAILDGS